MTGAGYEKASVAGTRTGALTRAADWLTQKSRRGRQVALVRIGVAVSWLVALFCDWPQRESVYGLEGAWTWGMASDALDSAPSLSLLSLSASPGWHLGVYLLAVVASVQLLVGWHTRLACVLFLLGVCSLQNYAQPLEYGADSLVRYTAIYLLASRCGREWSLDARRARRGSAQVGWHGVVVWLAVGALLAVCVLGASAGRLWLVTALVLAWAGQGWAWWARRTPESVQARWLEAAGNAVHNAAVALMLGQVILVYYSAGTAKLAGETWREGTAVYYALRAVGTPFPALTDAICSSQTLVALLTWATLFLQVCFPLALLHPRAKNWMLAATFFEHCGIALLMGLPYFSLAMLSADAIWLPAGPLKRFGTRASSEKVHTDAPSLPSPKASEESTPSGTPLPT